MKRRLQGGGAWVAEESICQSEVSRICQGINLLAQPLPGQPLAKKLHRCYILVV
jgi:hypothetical protein